VIYLGRPRNVIPQHKRNTIQNLIKRLKLDEVYLEDTDRICTECKFTHCGWYESKYENPCPLLNKKRSNKYMKLHKYVYQNLTKYGNAVISNETYETLGEQEILKDLEINGISNVIIDITADNTVIAKRSDIL
jgi:hypothetical protein